MSKFMLGLLSAAFGGAALADPPEDLFLALIAGPAVSPPTQFMYTFNAVFNMTALRAPAQSIVLNLPTGVNVVVPLETFQPRAGYLFYDIDGDQIDEIVVDPSAQPEDFSWRWYGRAQGWTVALTTERGVIAGRISGPNGNYAVTPRNGHVELGKVNSDHWKTHEEDTDAAASTVRSDTRAARSVPWIPASWNRSCPGSLPNANASSVIDVLVMYTSGTLVNNGDTEAGVRAVVQAAIDDANQSLRNSLVNTVTFSLRGVEFVGGTFNYDGTGIDNALYTFGGFRPSASDPYMTFPGNAYVQSRRNSQWADIVALARTPGDGTCGVSMIQRVTTAGYAYEPGADFEKFAYLVFNPACGPDRLNLAHELGHGMGMEHDPRNSETSQLSGYDPSCPWSYGHRRPLGPDGYRFRTVMAYWQQGEGGGGPGGCASNASCPVIDAYSQPAMVWANYALYPLGLNDPNAQPIGVATPTATQAAAKGFDTLSRLAPVVEAFRARPDSIFANGFQF
ncbi:MAG TPA: M12 family metallo-peptidase [Tahibacter sp.]|nr:M12 family metallo-peptidase [Tahibacter sp.]